MVAVVVVAVVVVVLVVVVVAAAVAVVAVVAGVAVEAEVELVVAVAVADVVDAAAIGCVRWMAFLPYQQWFHNRALSRSEAFDGAQTIAYRRKPSRTDHRPAVVLRNESADV